MSVCWVLYSAPPGALWVNNINCGGQEEEQEEEEQEVASLDDNVETIHPWLKRSFVHEVVVHDIEQLTEYGNNTLHTSKVSKYGPCSLMYQHMQLRL